MAFFLLFASSTGAADHIKTDDAPLCRSSHIKINNLGQVPNRLRKFHSALREHDTLRSYREVGHQDGSPHPPTGLEPPGLDKPKLVESTNSGTFSIDVLGVLFCGDAESYWRLGITPYRCEPLVFIGALSDSVRGYLTSPEGRRITWPPISMPRTFARSAQSLFFNRT
jgi:hypothetical protein